MLPKNKRIPREMFSLLLREARIFKNSLFLLKSVSSKENQSRFCFSVSKKISKSVVVRNRIRRSGYRLLKPLISDVKSNTLIHLSFIKIPKDNYDIIKNLENILKKLR